MAKPWSLARAAGERWRRGDPPRRPMKEHSGSHTLRSPTRRRRLRAVAASAGRLPVQCMNTTPDTSRCASASSIHPGATDASGRRTVVVTGASAGVGRAVAREFARHGWRVALLARGADGLEGARRDVERLGGEALVIPTDVADEALLDEQPAEAVAQQPGVLGDREPRGHPRILPRAPADRKAGVHPSRTSASTLYRRPDDWQDAAA